MIKLYKPQHRVCSIEVLFTNGGSHGVHNRLQGEWGQESHKESDGQESIIADRKRKHEESGGYYL